LFVCVCACRYVYTLIHVSVYMCVKRALLRTF
jgi:hypothetical protein